MTHDPFSPGISLPNLVGVIPDWVDQAACAGPNAPEGDLFFPVSEKSDHPATRATKKFCATQCPVKTDCLAYALTEQIDDGIWGGLTGTERRRLQGRRRKFSTPPTCRRCGKPADSPRAHYCGSECRDIATAEYRRGYELRRVRPNNAKKAS